MYKAEVRAAVITRAVVLMLERWKFPAGEIAYFYLPNTSFNNDGFPQNDPRDIFPVHVRKFWNVARRTRAPFHIAASFDAS